MPAFGNTIKPEELNALVAFLQSRKRPLPAQQRSTENEAAAWSRH
jgi:mono/diheme cytochrome c family protein